MEVWRVVTGLDRSAAIAANRCSWELSSRAASAINGLLSGICRIISVVVDGVVLGLLLGGQDE